MITTLRADADRIIHSSIQAVLPDNAVARALESFHPQGGRIVLVAAGKAAWQMAKAALTCFKARPELDALLDGGIVVTKYDHVKAPLEGLECYEAGHPVPDENSFKATARALEIVEKLGEGDDVIFLLSGGGSALFEKPLIPGEELQDITKQLLASGADITEMNTIRKRLSAVKGGKFALCAAPARVYSIVLSDVLGDPPGMIASGPAYPDEATAEDALAIAAKYQLRLSEKAQELLHVETPKALDNIETHITGSVRELCAAAAAVCKELGYEPILLTDQLTCEAREAGSFMASILKTYRESGEALAFLAGGETVVHLKGNGLGGRNQEIALSAARDLASIKGAALFSLGSDGTDGPTDAAGGYVDSETLGSFAALGIDPDQVLENNDAYPALKAVGGLIFTGPTGTNVNDVAVGLLQPLS